MKKLFFLLTLSMLFLIGCSTDEIQTNDQLSNDISKIELNLRESLMVLFTMFRLVAMMLVNHGEVNQVAIGPIL